MLYFLVFSLFMSISHLQASENAHALSLTAFNEFDQIKLLNGKLVKVRGFLYSNENKEWLLSQEPNVKSCCVGKLANPLFLSGSFNDNLINQVVEVEGMLTLHDHYFWLQNATLINKEKDYHSTVFLSIAVMGIASLVLLRKYSLC